MRMKISKLVASMVMAAGIFAGGTLGKNYLIYSQILKVQQDYGDQLQIGVSQWTWQEVELKEVVLAPKNRENLQYQAKSITLSHRWVHPFQIHVSLHELTDPQIRIETMEGDVTYWDNHVSSSNLFLKKMSIALKGEHVDLPLVHIPFSYNLKTDRLDLDASVPALQEGTLKGIVLEAKGSAVIIPSLHGQLDLHVKGMDRLLDVLVETGVIKQKKLKYFRLGARLLGGGQDEGTLPLSFDQGDIYLGPVLVYAASEQR